MFKNVRCLVMFDPDMRMEISIDLPVTWENVRCSLIMIDPDMSVEVSIDLLLKWQNRSCSVIVDLDMCIEIPWIFQ